MRLAIQGEQGSFSHEAALTYESRASIRACTVSEEAFAMLQAGEVDAAVLPIENSLAGSIVEHYDLLWRHEAMVVHELQIRIQHCLIGVPESELDGIHRVYSHPVALAQCRKFLAEHPRMEPVPFYDTAGSVKQLVELRDRHAGAIAGRHAARTYGGVILASGIEDDPENFTRFFVLRRAVDAESSVGNKLTIGFTVAHEPGTLVRALEVIADAKANLTKIQSRPVHGQPWHYVFYVDCLVTGSEMTQAVVEGLKGHCSSVRLLGRYQAAV